MMTNRERLTAAYRGEPVDRTPVRVWGAAPGMKLLHPSYQPILNAALERSDLVVNWTMRGGIFMSGANTIQSSASEKPSREHEGFIEKTITYGTPKGPLTEIKVWHPEGKPGMVIKHLIETTEDAERFLSMPYEPIRDDVAGFFELDRRVGERGIVIARLDWEPMWLVNYTMGSEQFAIWSLEHRDLLHTMISKVAEWTQDRVRHMLANKVGPFFGYVGPETCIPPLQSVHDFYDFVVAYDKPILDLIRNAGGHVWVHSHGKIRPVLKGFLDMGVTCLNPMEPPPMGDITLAQARALVGNRMCFEGNIEADDMFRATPEKIRNLAKEAIQQARGGGFILCPTSGFMEWPTCSDRLRDNYLALIDAVYE